MRHTRATLYPWAGPRARHLGIAALCLLTAAVTPAGAADFGEPTVIQLPQEIVLGELALDRGTLAVSAWPGAFDSPRSAVYVYERQRFGFNLWKQTAALEVDALQHQGESISLAGETLVVGVPGRDQAVVFGRSGKSWRQVRILRPPPGPPVRDAGFGTSVAVDGQRIAVGAPGRATVFVYGRHVGGPNRWGLTSTLEGRVEAAGLRACLDGSEPAPGFGHSVSLHGRTLIVGASDGRNPIGFVRTIVGHGNRANGVYVFELDPSSDAGWRQRRDIAPAPGCEAFATNQVSLSGSLLLVDNTGGQLTGTDYLEELEEDRWFVYERNLRGAGRWGRRTRLATPDGLQYVYQSTLRGNVAALAGTGDSAAWIFDRDYPVRNAWGLVDSLPFDGLDPDTFGGGVPFTDAVALGPREVVTSHPGPNVLLVFPRQPIMADDFETGDTSAWSGTRGALEVVAPGLWNSSASLAVSPGGDGKASFVASNRPAREPSVSVLFTLLPNDANTTGRPVEILRLYAGKPVLRLLLEAGPNTPGYTLKLEARLRNGAWRGVGAAVTHLSENDEWPITVEYRAPSATGAADGFARLDINGLFVHQARNLDMERRLVNRVVLGLPVGSPKAARGSFLIDNFELHR